MTQIIPVFKTKPKTLLMLITTSILTLSMTGCGGGSDGSSNDNTGNGGNSGNKPPVSTASFSETATWQVTNLALGSATCYDFDARAESSCAVSYTHLRAHET